MKIGHKGEEEMKHGCKKVTREKQGCCVGMEKDKVN